MKAYQIRIELKESNPILWRRVIMPADATFNKLNDIIQNVTNFKSGYPYDSYHLYEFLIPEEDIIITNDKEIYNQYKKFKKMQKKYRKK